MVINNNPKKLLVRKISLNDNTKIVTLRLVYSNTQQSTTHLKTSKKSEIYDNADSEVAEKKGLNRINGI